MVASGVLKPTESRKDYVEFYEEIGELGIERTIYDKDLVASERMRRIKGVILECVQSSSRSLDLGCYDGTYFETLASMSHSVVGLDIAHSALLRARESRAEHGTPSHLVRGDAEMLPFADGSVDLILMSETFEHLHNPCLAMRECHRVLSTPGLLILSTPNAIVVKSKSIFDLARNLLFQPKESIHLAQRNEKLENLGVHHNAYVHDSYTIAKLSRMGKEAGFMVTRSETCAPAPPRFVLEKVFTTRPWLYRAISEGIRYWPVLRLLGNHSVIVLRK
jgi:ubiquinone/menaquinone biosynthesis C-methylase UbiE